MCSIASLYGREPSTSFKFYLASDAAAVVEHTPSTRAVVLASTTYMTDELPPVLGDARFPKRGTRSMSPPCNLHLADFFQITTGPEGALNKKGTNTCTRSVCILIGELKDVLIDDIPATGRCSPPFTQTTARKMRAMMASPRT
ncbi:hypothetical protein DFH06DRAFT_1471747 [Mycena polygramma]|nr:hypothetical protein DFH06DRAFT_1471747 [Mycena polygramma]